ncbi:dTDP-4-dehydrorhamnose 3,5-epimerase family protein [soil metagenome]
MTTSAENGARLADPVPSASVETPQCDRGIGSVITDPSSADLIAGVAIQPIAVWPDDRGHFLEVLRGGHGLAAPFPSASTQVSATVTYPGVVKAFHYHRQQSDCWTVVKGMLQVGLVDLRKESPTLGRKNTLYIGDLRPWQLLIPPGVAHGYKVLGSDAAVLVYVSSRFYDPQDECRIAFDDRQLSYDWETQFK